MLLSALVLGCLALATVLVRAQMPAAYWAPGMGPVNMNWQWDTGRSEQFVQVQGYNGTWIWTFNDPGGNGYDSKLMVGRSTQRPQNWFARGYPESANGTEQSLFSISQPTPIRSSIAHNMRGVWVIAFSAYVGGSEDYDIFFVRSLDDGVTWSTAALLDTRAGSEVFRDEIPYLMFEPHNRIFWCAWTTYQQFPQDGKNNFNGDSDVVVANSTDDTASAWYSARYVNLDFNTHWDTEKFVKMWPSNNPPGTIHMSFAGQDLAYAGANLNVLSDYDIIILTKNASSDVWGNARPLNSEQGLNATNNFLEQYDTSIATDGTTVVFAYFRQLTQVWSIDVVFCVSKDGGWTFSAPILIEANTQSSSGSFLSAVTDMQGMFSVFYPTARSTYLPPGGSTVYTLGQGNDFEVFYTVITFANSSATSVRRTGSRPVDTANAVSTFAGDTLAPAAAIDPVTGDPVLFALSTKKNFLRMGTTWWTSARAESNVMAMTWDLQYSELCAINSPTLPVYCAQNLVTQVSAAPSNPALPTTIRIASLAVLGESGSIPTITLDSRKRVSITAAFQRGSVFTVGATDPSFIMGDAASQFTFASSSFTSLLGGSFLVDNKGESEVLLVDQGRFEKTFACPLGFLVPIGNGICTPCAKGQTCTARSAGASPSGSCTTGRYCPLATFDDSRTKCRLFRHYAPATPAMTSSANCSQFGTPCSPGYYCPPAALSAQHVPFLNASRTFFDETVVFPSDNTADFFVEVLPNNLFPVATTLQLFDDRATDPAFPKWLTVNGNFALPSTVDGTKTALAGVVKSKAPGVSISESLTLTYQLRFRQSTGGDELGLPLQLTFRRTVTTVVFNPEEGIIDYVSIFAQPFVRELLIFNIGCESSLNWTAEVVNCTDPTSPLDWVSLLDTSGLIALGSVDPAILRLGFNTTQSATQSGGALNHLISQQLAQREEVAQEGSILGISGTFTAKACINVRFRLLSADNSSSTGQGELTKTTPIEIRFFETCPPGQYSVSGTSEGGSCDPCPLGTYSPDRGATVCRACPENLPRTVLGTKHVEDCMAAPGSFMDTDGTVHRCDLLGPGVECLSEGMRLETLRIKRGYWRSYNKSKRVMRCVSEPFCRGSADKPTSSQNGRRRLSEEMTNEYCVEHHRGPMCEACEPGYVRRGMSLCEQCSVDAVYSDQLRLGWTIFAAVLIVLIAFVIVQWAALSSFWKKSGEALRQMPRRISTVAFSGAPAFGKSTSPPNQNRALASVSKTSIVSSSSDPGSSSRPRSKRHPVEMMRTMSVRVREKTKLDKRVTLLWAAVVSIEANTTVRILLSLFQVTNGVSKTFYELLPSGFHAITAAFNVVSAELFYRIDFGCIVKSNHNLSLVLSMAAPAILTALILIIHIIFERRLRAQRRLTDVPKLRHGSFSIFLVLLFLVYPGVSNTVLSTFACREFDGGMRFLRKDLTVSCQAPDRDIWLAVAGIGVAVYVIGIPLFYAQALFRVRRFLAPKNGEKPDPANFPSVHFLTGIYKPRYYWWEVFELIRKLVQTSLVVFIVDGSLLQAIFMVTFTMVVVILLNELKPYVSSDANRLAYVAQWQILIISFFTLLYRVDLTEIDRTVNYDKKTLLDVCVIGSCFITPIVALYQGRHALLKFARFTVNKIRKNCCCGRGGSRMMGTTLTNPSRVDEEDEDAVGVEDLGGAGFRLSKREGSSGASDNRRSTAASSVAETHAPKTAAAYPAAFVSSPV